MAIHHSDKDSGVVPSTGKIIRSPAQPKSRRLKCERCLRPQTHCLCALIPVLPSRTRIVVLQHPDESRHALNTARLAVLGLPNAVLHVGLKFDAALWNVAGYRPHLLFPGEGAQVLVPGAAATVSTSPYLLVVPDGTWRHARHLLSQHPDLAALPRVTLPEGTTTRYRVRHAGDARALSTIEAISEALNSLESPHTFESLLAPFDALIAGQIAGMGSDRYQRDHVLREGTREARKREM